MIKIIFLLNSLMGEYPVVLQNFKNQVKDLIGHVDIKTASVYTWVMETK